MWDRKDPSDAPKPHVYVLVELERHGQTMAVYIADGCWIFFGDSLIPPDAKVLCWYPAPPLIQASAEIGNAE